jgi:hypothetical protein
MGTAIRALSTRRLGAAIGAALLVVTAPATALAEHRDERRGFGWYDDDRDRHHHRHRGGWHHHHHGGFCAAHPGYGRGPFHGYWSRPRPARGISFHRAAPAYVCGPCGLRFGAYDHLLGHVHHHHHVPAWRAPGLITQVSFGFVFGD